MSKELVTITMEIDFDQCIELVNQYQDDQEEGWTDERRKALIAAVIRDGMHQSWEWIYNRDLERDDPIQTGFAYWFANNDANIKTFSITSPPAVSI